VLGEHFETLRATLCGSGHSGERERKRRSESIIGEKRRKVEAKGEMRDMEKQEENMEKEIQEERRGVKDEEGEAGRERDRPNGVKGEDNNDKEGKASF
jgi:hypothetical protein